MSFLALKHSKASSSEIADWIGTRLGKWLVYIDPSTRYDVQKYEDREVILLGRPYERNAAVAPQWESVFAHEGLYPLERIDGSFAALCYDHGTGALWTGTDRYASQLIYLGSGLDGCVSVAGTSAAMVGQTLADDGGLDTMAFYQWLGFGYIPSHRTLARCVQRQRYATWTCLDNGEYRNYWNYCSRVQPIKAPETEIYSRLSELQDQAVERALSVAEKQNGVLLSGGWDSRAMICRLAQTLDTARLHSICFGPADSQDVELASAIAKRIGTTFTSRAYDFERVDSSMQHWARLLGDLSDNVFATLPGGAEQLARLPGECLWLGTDSFSTVLPPATPNRDTFSTPGGGQLGEDAIRLIGLIFGAVSSKTILPNDVMALNFVAPNEHDALLSAYVEVEAAVMSKHNEPYAETFDRASHETRFRLWNINRRLFESEKPVLTPFHDVDLVEFYTSIPVEFRHQRRAHQKANLAGHSLFVDLPIHSRGLAINHLDVIRESNSTRDAMLESIENSSEVRKRIDISAIRERVRTAPEVDDGVLLLMLRTYLAATTRRVMSTGKRKI